MQFSIVAVALFAGAVMAGEQHTVYQSETITVTSCAPTVTDCPAKSTVTSVTSYPVVPTTYPSGEETTPAAPEYPVVPTSYPAAPTYPVYHNGSSSEVPAPTSYPSGEETTPAVPEYPVETASYSTYTLSTCIPTVITTSVLITPTPAPVPTTYAPVSPPYSTGTVVVPGNSTVPTTPSNPEFTGAASAVRGSFAVAAVAGVVAFFL